MLKANFHFTSQRFIVIALLLYRQFCNLIFLLFIFVNPFIYLFIYCTVYLLLLALQILNAFRIIIIITIIIILRSGGGGCGSWITVVLWAGVFSLEKKRSLVLCISINYYHFNNISIMNIIIMVGTPLSHPHRGSAVTQPMARSIISRCATVVGALAWHQHLQPLDVRDHSDVARVRVVWLRVELSQLEMWRSK
eukprot:gene1491-878_t